MPAPINTQFGLLRRTMAVRTSTGHSKSVQVQAQPKCRGFAAGDGGRVDIVFYQSNDLGDPNTSNLHWNVIFAQSLNGNAREPVFTVSQASDHVTHFGPICNLGLLCSSGTRVLLDFFEVAIGPDGLANIAYADTATLTRPRTLLMLGKLAAHWRSIIPSREPVCRYPT